MTVRAGHDIRSLGHDLCANCRLAKEPSGDESLPMVNNLLKNEDVFIRKSEGHGIMLITERVSDRQHIYWRADSR